MNRLRSAALAGALALAAGASQAAGVQLGIEARGGYQDFSRAHDSMQAIFDSSGGGTFGLGLRGDVGRHVFLRVGASYLKKDGERVFVADATSPVFKLGHPLELKLIPAYFDAALKLSTSARLQPYLGLGAGAVSYKEKSTVAGLDITNDQTLFSARALAGVTLRQGHFLFGLEAAYATTPNAFGDDVRSVARVYDEKDLGGFSGAATLTWRP
jgi:opacity protein-like surface antigen